MATQNSLDIQEILFTLEVEKTNIGTTGPATLWVTVPRSWVEAQGGMETLYALRIGDDGMREILPVAFDHTEMLSSPDADSNTEMYVFRITSPRGLSIYGMATAKLKATALGDTPGAPPPRRRCHLWP